jgi:hypothetical protein
VVKEKNEKGYALVTVLVIITLFMVISLSFMGQAFNSVKQNKVVEKSSQSVAIAEMGISYYQVAVKNAFITQKMDYDNLIKTTSLTKEEITTGIISAATTALPNGTKTILDGKPEADSETYYTIEEASVLNNSGILNITFLVKGNKGTEDTPLRSEMSINLSDLTITYGTDIPTLPGYIGIVQPTNISSTCINPPDNYDFKENECSSGILITRPDADYIKNFQKFNGTIYATDSTTGVLTLSGVGNKSSLKIHAPSLSLDGVQNNVTNVTMEIKGNLSFGGHFDATAAANIFVGGDVNVQGKFELHNNSDKMYQTLIRGKFTSNGNKVLIGQNNTMCVKDVFTAPNDFQIDGTLYLSKQKNNVNIPSNYVTLGKIKYIEDVLASEIKANCGNTFEGPDDYIDWGEHAQTNVDNIHYN